jgi:hypothetical protein
VLKAEILRQDLISAPAKKIRKVIMDMDFDDQSSIKFKAMTWRQRESKKLFGVESTMLGSWGGLFQWCSNNTLQQHSGSSEDYTTSIRRNS